MTSDRTGLEILPLSAERLDDLTDLFDSNATTRGCWCMYFISPASEFRAGWGSGENGVRFRQLAANADPPMGLVAYEDGTPVGWCALGPRSRYPRTISSRAVILRDRDPAEDEDVWLVPCFFVRVGHRRHGVTHALLDAAVELARQHGATAVEGFPLSTAKADPDGYLGREGQFAACGFEPVRRPTPRRVVMRRTLG